MKKWQWKSSAVLLTGALTFGTPVSALAEVENRAAAESMSKEESHEEKIGAASEVKETDSDENTEPEKGETAPDAGEESAADREPEKESEKDSISDSEDASEPETDGEKTVESEGGKESEAESGSKEEKTEKDPESDASDESQPNTDDAQETEKNPDETTAADEEKPDETLPDDTFSVDSRIREIIKQIAAFPEAKEENLDEIAEQLEEMSRLYEEIDALPEEKQLQITNLDKLVKLLQLASSQVEKVAATSGVCGTNVRYSLSDAGTLTISGSGKMADYTDSRRAPWYSQRTAIKKIVIGSGVTAIGNQAFCGCTELNSVTIATSVKKIGGEAFSECISLVKVTLPKNMSEMGAYAFANCDSLTTISEIPGTLKKIPEGAFKECSSLMSVSLSYGVTVIADDAFANCYSLTAVKLPGTVSEIGSGAFSYCEKLNSATIPGAVSEIGASAFANSGIKRLVLNEGIGTIENQAFYGCAGLTSVTVPASVSSIGRAAFAQCSNLKTLVLKNGLNTIGDSAFRLCDRLKSVTIPGSVASVGASAFSHCSSLTDAVMERGVENIGSSAFSYCPKLTAVTVPASVFSIGSETFRYSDSVKMYGTSGSYAETYAKANQIPFTDPGNVKLDIPVIAKASNTVSGIHVYWKTVSKATSYTIYRSVSQNGTYTRLATISAANYTDQNIESGKTYYYKVRANMANVQSAASAAKQMTFVATPDITLRVNRSTGVGLGWDRITGATGYAVYRKSYSGSDAWVRVATLTNNATTKWTDPGVRDRNGSVYRYTVRALAGSSRNILSGCRNTGRTMARLITPALNTASAVSATSLKASWGRNSQADGYEVRLMTGSTIYKTYTVSGASNLEKTVTGLKADTTYKVQVRAYKKVSGVGSFYSAWSEGKSVAVK